MKNIITLINLSIIFGITAIFTTKNKSAEKNLAAQATMSAPVKQVEASIEPPAVSLVTNHKKDVKISEGLASSDLDFITRSVEICLVKLEEGKIAQNQTKMLADLKTIAASKSVITYADMPDNFYALEDLRQLQGELFDKRFVKKLLYNYKRDLKDLQRATRSDDADIKVFATKYLPVMKANYERMKSLKKKL